MDRYLERPPEGTPEADAFRVALRNAIWLYVATVEVWQAKIALAGREWGDVLPIANHPVLERCQELADFVNSTDPGRLSQETARAIAVTSGIPLIWGCATVHLRTAESAWPAAPTQ